MTLSYKQQHGSIRLLTLFQNRVTLFCGSSGHVARWFLAAQSDQQGLSGRETVEGDPGLYESHRTDITCDIDVSVGGQNGIHDTCPP
jgi:hypothetical protein